MKTAIVFGATGFIGSYLLRQLLNHAEYSQVTIVTRKKPAFSHPKMKVLIGEYNSISLLTKNIQADEIFIALGTTKKKTPDPKKYYEVDHDYAVLAARIAKENGARSIFLVSAVGANERSGIFYTRTKGETERDISALHYNSTHIFRPSLIMGNRQESRPVEKAFIKLWSFINPLLAGGLSKYKGLTGEDIAKAMIAAAQQPPVKLKIYHWQEMQLLLQP